MKWILNHMVKYKGPQLDAVFAALADSTRRGILESLSGGESGGERAGGAHDMSLPGFMKHLRVLEDAGLVERTKEGRVVSCELSAAPMQAAAAWISRYEKFWTDKLEVRSPAIFISRRNCRHGKGLAPKPSLTLTRRYAKAPGKVWRAWTDPEAITRWFGPGLC